MHVTLELRGGDVPRVPATGIQVVRQQAAPTLREPLQPVAPGTVGRLNAGLRLVLRGVFPLLFRMGRQLVRMMWVLSRSLVALLARVRRPVMLVAGAAAAVGIGTVVVRDMKHNHDRDVRQELDRAVSAVVIGGLR